MTAFRIILFPLHDHVSGVRCVRYSRVETRGQVLDTDGVI